MSQKLGRSEVLEIFPEIADIKDAHLRDAIIEIWQEIAEEMKWPDLRRVPKNTKSGMGRDLVTHIRTVIRMARAICDIAREVHGTPYDADLLLAGCLLHDASKAIETEPTGAKPAPGAHADPGAFGPLGQDVQHGVYAAHKAFSKKLSPKVANLIITHTHHSNERGKTWEAAALFYADYADSDAGLSADGKSLFLERWILGPAQAAH